MRHRLLAESDGERTYAMVLDPGEEPVSAVTAFARQEGLRGAHFTAIGAFSRATLGFFDLRARDYKRIEVGEQAEVVSLSGNVAESDGEPKVHAHAVLARSDGTAVGGHLLSGRVDPTLEVVLVESPAHLRRVVDQRTGLPLLAL